jgi:predicted Rossmann fold nucleotide-binding protein DprA/Smf involved in DNA uptake
MEKSFIQTSGKPCWQRSLRSTLLLGVGEQRLLDQELMAFFASRQCSGAAIRLAMDWALAQAAKKQAVVSGFHSPLEQSVLKVLLQAKSPMVAVLARPVSQARLSAEWHTALEQGRMAVVSAEPHSGRVQSRLTATLASERNDLVARLAGRITVAHASPGGDLERTCQDWEAQGMKLERLT